jgi:hypothetical protein
MTKIEDWLETISDPIVRKQAIYNRLLYKTNFINATSLNMALHMAFIWKTSIEGHDYWKNFTSSIK